MWIEHLFNQVGVSAAFAACTVGVALPLAVVGGLLRRRARRERTRWELIDAARAKLRDVAPGRVAVEGSWRNLDGRALVEEGDDCVLVERGPDAVEVAEGARVLVVGYATRQADNPRGGAFRDRAKVWLIEGDGARDPVLVSATPSLPAQSLRSARLRSRLGFALLGASVAVAVGTAVLCYRADAEDSFPDGYVHTSAD